MNVLVLGAHGMAGHIITRYLKQHGHNVGTMARFDSDFNLDIEDAFAVCNLIDRLPEVDYVINCCGLLVKDSLARPDRAAILNGWFPRYIEHKYSGSNTRVIHISTDCVFSGSKGNYIETDLPTETTAYGKAKSYGELNNSKDITFRTSIIGTELRQPGNGLMNWILTNPDSEIFGWANAHWSGITTLQLAKSINDYMLDPSYTGLYHLVSPVSISKFELLSLINDVFNLGKTVIRTLGPKPVNKVLIDTRKLVKNPIPDYTTQLVEMKNFLADKRGVWPSGLWH